jgi:hypothetical protein
MATAQPTKPDVPDSEREALERLIGELKREFYPWYERASQRSNWLWNVGTWLALIAGLGATIIVGFKESGIVQGKFWVAMTFVLPAFGSLCAILQSRFLERKNLREVGRLTMKQIVWEAERRFAESLEKTGDFAKIHEDIAERVTALENAQLEGFIALARGEQDSTRPPKRE